MSFDSRQFSSTSAGKEYYRGVCLPNPGLLDLLHRHATGFRQTRVGKKRVEDYTSSKEEKDAVLNGHRQCLAPAITGGSQGSACSQSILQRIASISGRPNMQCGVRKADIVYIHTLHSCFMLPAPNTHMGVKLTCMLQSIVLKNWPMIKLAKKLKKTEEHRNDSDRE